MPVSPYTKFWSVLLEPPEALLTKAPMMELRVMAVDARSVEAMMLLRSVCTAKTPFFKLSCTLNIQQAESSQKTAFSKPQRIEMDAMDWVTAKHAKS